MENLPEVKQVQSPILQAALNPDLDVDKMEKLYDLYVKDQEREAVKEFNSAMSRVQSKIGPIVKDKKNTQTGSKYAKLETIITKISPVYSAEGFALSFNTGKSECERCILITCEVSHSSGHSKTYQYDSPIDDKGAKGNANKTEAHGRGSATAYGRRYLTAMIFNLAIADEDKDGNLPGDRITQEQQDEINFLLKNTGSNKNKFLEYLDCKSVETIPMAKYGMAIAALRKKKK